MKRLLLLGGKVFAFMILLAAVAVAGAPTPTTLQISVNPTSISPTGSALVTATVTPNTGTINCGKGQIQYNINNTGWVQLANNLAVSNNQFSATFNATGLVIAGDTVLFRAGYDSTGSDCDFQSQAIGLSPTAQLDIVEEEGTCPNGQTTGVHITIEAPDGQGCVSPGGSGPWSFIVRVTACEDVYDVSAQGGANGWSPVKLFSTATGTVNEYVKNKNTVYLWTIGDIPQGESRTLEISVDATIKNKVGECGKTKLLNGSWSALYATTGGGPLTKSDYTDYISTIEINGGICPDACSLP